MQYIVNCINPEGPGFESQPLHICVGKAWGLKQPFPRPRTVREAYGTGYALFGTTMFMSPTSVCIY